MAQLQPQDTVEVVLRRRGSEPFLELRDAVAGLPGLERGDPLRRGGEGAGGLQLNSKSVVMWGISTSP